MTHQISRRSLLQGSLAVGAGLWVGGSARAKSSSPNEKLNIACIGIGGRGGANLGGVRGQNIVALCDVDEKRGAAGFKKFPAAKRYTDFRRLYDEMSHQIDAVVISTPDHTHFHPAYYAMQLKKHVYLEKPMAHNVWEIRTLTEYARKQKVATQLGVQRHTIPNMHRVVELIQAGAIGKVSEVHAWIGGTRGMPKLPTKFPEVPEHLDWDLWLGPAADRKYSPDYCPYNWRFWWDFGTGETGNWGCHILDIPFWALGLSTPDRVEADVDDVDPQRTPKALSTKLRFPKEGVTLHWSHSKAGPRILKDEGIPGKGLNNVFVGDKGILACGFSSRKLYPLDKFKDYEPPKPTIPDSPGFYEEWITACKGGPAATCHFDYSGPLSETVLLANTAVRGGSFDWNSETLTAKCDGTAQQFVREDYRKGWEVKGS